MGNKLGVLTGAVALVLVVGLCYLRVPDTEYGAEVLWRTAQATSLGLLLATLAAGWLVKRVTGALLSPLTALRVGGAMAVAIAVGRFLPSAGKVMTIAYAAIIVVTYVVMLLATRELNRADLGNLKAIVTRKKG